MLITLLFYSCCRNTCHIKKSEFLSDLVQYSFYHFCQSYQDIREQKELTWICRVECLRRGLAEGAGCATGARRAHVIVHGTAVRQRRRRWSLLTKKGLYQYMIVLEVITKRQCSLNNNYLNRCRKSMIIIINVRYQLYDVLNAITHLVTKLEKQIKLPNELIQN